MRRHGFLEKDLDLALVYANIKTLLASEGFSVTSEETRENYWDLHAKKSGVKRIVLGQVRDIDVIVAGTKGRFEVQLRVGIWGKDLAVPVIESIATFGVVGLEEQHSSRELEERLWEQIVHKIDSSLSICEYDGLLFKTDEELQNHLKKHRQAAIDDGVALAEGYALANSMAGGMWV